MIGNFGDDVDSFREYLLRRLDDARARGKHEDVELYDDALAAVDATIATTAAVPNRERDRVVGQRSGFPSADG